MRIVVWVLAGIVVVDLVLVAGFAGYVSFKRRQESRPAVDRRGMRLVEPGELIHPLADEARRPIGRRLIGIALVAAVVFGITTLTIPQARDAVATALGTVFPGLRSTSSEQDGATTTGPREDRPSTSDARPGIQSPGGAPAAGTGPTGSIGESGTPGGSGSPDPTQGTTDPVAPISVTAVSDSSTEVQLAWAGVADGTAYRVERSVDGTAGWIAIASTAEGVTTYTDGGLASGDTYFYRVFATDASGDSPPSDVASATTTAVPGSPTSLSAITASSTEVDLSWADVADETGYRVERSADGATGWTTIATTGQGVTAYDDTGLASGSTYFYRVVAANGGVDSQPSDVVSALTPVDPASPAPSSEAPTS